jgi:hypothetical protein
MYIMEINLNTNWKTIWKQRANDKANDAVDHFQYCILKALFAKSNAKKEIGLALLKRAFTPTSYGSWDGLNEAGRYAAYRKTIFGRDWTELVPEELQEAYKELVRACQGPTVALSENDYLFIFVRQDISPEQQAVQSAHAVYKAGCEYKHKPDETYFVLIGVANEEELEEAKAKLASRSVEFVEFYEPDLGDSLTAIATRPIKEHRKRFLKHYRKLQF